MTQPTIEQVRRQCATLAASVGRKLALRDDATEILEIVLTFFTQSEDRWRGEKSTIAISRDKQEFGFADLDARGLTVVPKK
jgi:hypothetical protein